MIKNEAQERVINEIDGQMIVIACPGSGKTTTILRRIHHMVFDLKIAPEEILMITFTKAAAEEMRNRYKTKYGDPKGITFCTIHALCLAILTKFTNYSKDNLLSNPSDLLFDLIRNNHKINDKGKFVQDLIMDITVVKNSCADLKQYNPKCCESRDDFVLLYKAYENKKTELGLIDFDDIIIEARELLINRPEVLSWMREKYKYIHVDEYQDTNTIQGDIVYLIAGENGNLVVVGDDDQSIYGFRGASPQIMLDFMKVYPHAKKINMTTNYRSDRKIIDSAKAVIDKNKNRFQKEFLYSSNNAGRVNILNCSSKNGQYALIGKTIKGLITEGVDPSDIALLYRTNAQADPLVSLLGDLSIPFYSNDRLESRYNHWIYHDIVSYHKVAVHEGSKMDVQRTITHPNRYFKGGDVSAFNYDPVKLYKYLYDPTAEEWKNSKLKERVYEYTGLLKMIEKASPLDTMNRLRLFGNYDGYLESYAKYRNIDVDEYKNVWTRYIDDLKKNDIKTFEEWDQYRMRYEQYLKKIQQNHTGVCLSTMHKSKGLEWRHVFIIDCVDSIIPYIRNGSTDLEDERRLFYVAMTRAKNELNIYTYNDKSRGLTASRFLQDIAV